MLSSTTTLLIYAGAVYMLLETSDTKKPKIRQHGITVKIMLVNSLTTIHALRLFNIPPHKKCQLTHIKYNYFY